MRFISSSQFVGRCVGADHGAMSDAGPAVVLTNIAQLSAQRYTYAKIRYTVRLFFVLVLLRCYR